MNLENNPEEPYPDIPEIENSDSTSKSIFNFILFGTSFYFLLDKDIKLMMILILVIIIHELGHFIAMKRFNYKDVKMFFIPFVGAMVSGNKTEISQKQRAIVLLSGPVPGILFGLPLYFWGMAYGDLFIIQTANVFIIVNAFNLLPITPLDGGNLIDTLFLNPKSKVQVYFMVLSAIGLTVLALYLESYFLLIIPFFLIIQLNARKKFKKVKSNLDSIGINYDKNFEDLTNKEFWVTRENIINELTSLKKYNGKDYSKNKNEKQIFSFIKSLHTPRVIKDLSKNNKTIITSFWIVMLIIPAIVFQSFSTSDLIENISFQDKYRIEVQACMEAMGEIGEKYPDETYDYCTCTMDKVYTNFTEEELKGQSNLSKEEKTKILQPIFQSCLKSLSEKIPILYDSIPETELK